MPQRHGLGMDVQQAVAVALSFAEGVRTSGATVEVQAKALLDHLARNGFLVVPRVGRETSRDRQLSASAPNLTGADVRAARAAVGLDRSQLAEMAGIKRRTLQDLESGRRVPHQRTLDAISAALDEAVLPANTPGQSDSP